jgi:3-oxoacyl-[acyl-carrier protein] reductase
LVTGGSGSIGSAICKRLGALGHHVYVHTHRRPEDARDIAASIRDTGGSAEPIQFDVTDRSATAAVLQEVLGEGAVQILINNAGFHDDAPLAGMRPAQWHGVIDVVLHGFFNVTQPLLLPMIASRWGRIVNVSSISALAGNRGQANYAAAKAALIAAGKSLAIEIASRGVTVNSVAPGIIATAASAGAFPPERIDQLVPMKRAGTVDDVAHAVAFLVSEDAGYISGQVLSVNGAMY